MSSPDCKRQKLAGNVNSVAEMSNVSPKKDYRAQAGDVTITASASKKKSIINVGAQLFEDVACLDGFVDRTMLIKELRHNEPIMIFAPSKFGKTVNLNMVRFFYDIEDKKTKTKEGVAKDPTMQELRSNPSEKMKVLLRQFKDNQYEECLILKQEEFVIQHFGRHPVISFNFQSCYLGRESEGVVECAVQVMRSYMENCYLVNSKEFKSNNEEHVLLKQACADWCSYNYNDLKKLSVDEVILGLKNLIKSLRIHWGRDPVFLVDEIDKPCIHAIIRKFSESQICKIGTVVSDVVCSILKQGEKELQLQAALVTGIINFKNSGSSPVDNTVKTYFLGDARFSKYYGLTAKEVDSLVRKFYVLDGDAEIASIINKINKYYSGYYQRSFTSVKEKQTEYDRYCLFSVLSYMKQRSENKNSRNVRFRKKVDLMDELASVLKKSDVIMSAVQTLLYDDSGTIAIMYQRALNAEHLLGIYHEEIVPDPDATFNFLLQAGFLAHNIEKPEENVVGGLKIHVRIPNLEIKGMYNEMFYSYRVRLPENVGSAFTSCGEFFQSLPTELERFIQNSTYFRKGLDTLCANLKDIFSFAKCESEASVCSYMLTILNLYAEYEKVALNYPVEYLDNGKQNYVNIDVWAQHGNFALILKAKHNVDANGEPGKIGCKTKSSLAAAEDIVTLLPGKQYPEDRKCSKAGTGRNLEVLKSSQIKSYLLMALAVDGDGTTHMLVFPNSTDWKNVITVNPENYVAELISTHLKSE